jgi:hypothetical protein
VTITATGGGGGSSQFVTTAAGIHTLRNVGIGTTNPTSALTVSGNAFISGIVTASSFSGSGSPLTGIVTSLTAGSGISLNQSTGNVTITATGGGGGSSQFVTTAAGIHTLSNVGIGTTNPTSALTVSGVVSATSFYGALNAGQLTGPLPAIDGSALLNVTAVGTGVAIRDDNSIIGSASTINFGTGLDVTFSSGIATVVASGGDNSSQWVTTAAGIHTLSNVGIGTTNPTSKLHIVGDTLVSGIVTASSFNGYQTLVGAASSATKTFIVTVASKTTNHRYYGIGSTLGYFIDGSESPFITLLPGKTYRFNQENISNLSHPLRFYFQSDKTTQYSTNVTTNETAGNASAYTEITITDTTPIVLHYQCSAHGYMGNAVSVNSNFIDTPYQITARNGINVIGNINSSGVSTFATVSAANVNTSGVTTSTGGFVGALTGNVTGNINSSGISTFVTVSAANVNTSGVTTSTGGFVGNVTGNINSSGISTFTNGPILIGSGTSTGTASQRLQVTGSAYVSGNLGIGTTNPMYKMDVVGDINTTTDVKINGISVLTSSINDAVALAIALG